MHVFLNLKIGIQQNKSIRFIRVKKNVLFGKKNV